MSIDTSMYGQPQPGSPVPGMQQMQQNPINVLLQRLFGNGTGVGLQQLMQLLGMGHQATGAPHNLMPPAMTSPAMQPQTPQTNPLLAGLSPRPRPATSAPMAGNQTIAY